MENSSALTLLLAWLCGWVSEFAKRKIFEERQTMAATTRLGWHCLYMGPIHLTYVCLW